MMQTRSEASWNASRSVETTQTRCAGLVGRGGERADHVVGLIARHAEVAVAEGLDERLEDAAAARAAGRASGAGGPCTRGRARAGRWASRPRPRARSAAGSRSAASSACWPSPEARWSAAVGGLQLLGQGEERAVGEPVAVDQEDVACLAGASSRSDRRGCACFTVATDAAYPRRRCHPWARYDFPTHGDHPLSLLQPDHAGRDPVGVRLVRQRRRRPSARRAATSGAIDLVRVTSDHTVRDITVRRGGLRARPADRRRRARHPRRAASATSRTARS